MELLTIPDARLLQMASPVEAIDGEVRDLLDHMRAIMRQGQGIGLAAPQVGVGLRCVVWDLSTKGNSPFALINPVITRSRGFQQMEEGCLSVPGRRVKVARASHVEVEGLKPTGGRWRFEASGLLAICLQHEIDHLDGRLIISPDQALGVQISDGPLSDSSFSGNQAQE